MTATITSIHGDGPERQVPRTLLDPSGTDFVYEETDSDAPSAFYARVPGSGDINFLALNYVLELERPAQQTENAKALREIALAVLSEPYVTDPNVRYATAVHQAILESLHAADRISTADFDELMQALDVAVEHAANAVAAAWLRERGSIPLRDHAEPLETR